MRRRGKTIGLRQVVVMLLACNGVAGCGVVGTATHNVLSELHQHEEDWAETRRERELADAAWDHWRTCKAETSFSDAFGDGFRAGYADFLYAGGNGEPPVMPPRKFWKADAQNPEGAQAMRDWFAGFRAGASDARDSGARQWVLLPSSASEFNLDAPASLMPPPLIDGPPPDRGSDLPPPRPVAVDGVPIEHPAPSAKICAIRATDPQADRALPRGIVRAVKPRSATAQFDSGQRPGEPTGVSMHVIGLEAH